ncbi:MAG: hypothetical protein PVF58_07365 [Candidatus Methanofastidiosia archaeon]|jgi:hypothetical protein
MRKNELHTYVEESAENQLWDNLNKYILSKEINSVENPRKWHNVIEKNEENKLEYFLLSSNPDIDHEKLNNVYNKLKEKLTEDYEIAIMDSDNVEYDKSENKE